MIFEIVIAGLILMAIWWLFKTGLIWPLALSVWVLFLFCDRFVWDHMAGVFNSLPVGTNFKLGV